MSNPAQAPKLSITAEDTPNPNSTRFALNRTLLSGAGRDFPDRQAAEQSPLAKELFALNNIRGVFIGPNFVTVTVAPDTDWWSTRALVSQTLETFLGSGQPVIGESAPAQAIPGKALTATEHGILRVLENEIRPAVAMDGGDITFASFENGVVKLHLRGACHSCPSSLLTLKAGIENRLKQEFPDVLSVEAV